MTECGHCFHVDCLQKWIDYSNTSCPICRRELYCGGDCWWSDPLKFFKTIPNNPYSRSDLVVSLNCWKVLFGRDSLITKRVSSEEGCILFLEYLFEQIYKKTETDHVLYRWILKKIINGDEFKRIGDNGICRFLKFLLNHPTNYITNENMSSSSPMFLVQKILLQREHLSYSLLSPFKEPLKVFYVCLLEDKLKDLLRIVIDYLVNNKNIWNIDDLWILRDGWSLIALAAHKGSYKAISALNELGMERMPHKDYKKFLDLNPISIKGNRIYLKGNKKITIKIDPLMEALLTENVHLCTSLINTEKKHLLSPYLVEKKDDKDKNGIMELLLKLKEKFGFKKNDNMKVPQTHCDRIKKNLYKMERRDAIMMLDHLLMVE